MVPKNKNIAAKKENASAILSMKWSILARNVHHAEPAKVAFYSSRSAQIPQDCSRRGCDLRPDDPSFSLIRMRVSTQINNNVRPNGLVKCLTVRPDCLRKILTSG